MTNTAADTIARNTAELATLMDAPAGETPAEKRTRFARIASLRRTNQSLGNAIRQAEKFNGSERIMHAAAAGMFAVEHPEF